ncbi:MAG: PLP-dependent aminotransferase family protein [Taibaiella sp.]|nr:PLP-dependent aminotransferase family protein [Taibaiella sp.]
MLRPWKLELQLDPASDKAIYLQIADAIIADIQSGRLKSGTALPGSRILARDLQLNRNTIVEALNVLLHEEWLVSKERKGTFVADVLPALPVTKQVAGTVATPETPKIAIRINFDDGSPDSKIAPVAALARAYRQIFNRKARWQMMGYGDDKGDTAFRNAIVQMLNHQRGMQLDEQQLFITRGSQMAMYLTAHCLLKKGDYVLVESPGYQPAWRAFEHAGAQLLPVKVDQDGLMVEEVRKWLQRHPGIKAIYTTPHHQYPTTVTLSLQRRLELIRLSNEYDFTIIEDDYDNEFHFGYRPVLPLSSYPELKNYVYIGTMSKVVAPALRIGYLASKDKAFLDLVAAHRRIIDVQGDAIMEQAVLQLIQDGTIKRHLKKATQYYKGKRDVVAALLKKYLGSKAGFDVPEGGLAFWVAPKCPVDWQLVQAHLQQKGIRILHPETYSFKQTANGLRLGYAYLSEAQLEEGLKALGACL